MSRSWELDIQDKADAVIVLSDECIIDPHSSVYGVSWRTHDGVATTYPWHRILRMREFWNE